MKRWIPIKIDIEKSKNNQIMKKISTVKYKKAETCNKTKSNYVGSDCS